MSVLSGVAIAAAATAAVAWLAVSFSSPGRRREIVAWIATVAIYAALSTFFLDLAWNAWDEQSPVALVAFAILAALFAAGFLLSAVKLGGRIRGGDSGSVSPTD